MTQIMSRIKSFRWQHFLIIAMIATIVVGTEGCKTSGKLSKKERKALIENAKKQLLPIINGTSTLSLDDQARVISEIINKNLNDPELNEMIIQAQQKMKKEYTAQEKAKEAKVDAARALLYDMLLNKDNKTADQLEQQLDGIKAQNLGNSEIDELITRVEKKIAEMRSFNSGANLPVRTQLENAFQDIITYAKAGNITQADNTIVKTLQLFSAPDAPVLIIISREGNNVDYDKPTNIRYYLNFLKDQKVNRNTIDALQMDGTGKIKELDLIKK